MSLHRRLTARLAAAASISVLVCASAFAADAPIARAPVAKSVIAGHPAFDWTGFYAGVHAGYGTTRPRGDYDEAGDHGAFDFRSSGFLAGGQFGYDWQTGRLVQGLVLDGSWANLKGSRVDGDGDTQRFKTDFLGSLRYRSGIAIEDKLLYSTIGLAYSRNKFSVVEGGVPASASVKDWGLVTGFGMEWAFAPNWSASAEYLHYRFDKRVSTATLTADSDSNDFIRANNLHAVRFLLNYRPGLTPARSVSAPAANFAGGYAGLHGGYGSMRSNGTYDEAGDNGGFVLDANGFAGGGQLGYNVQRGAWVYGVEIDGTWTGLDKGRTDGEGDTQKSKITSLASARGRLGVVAENKMFFITGGVGYVRGKFQVNEGGVPASVSYSQVVPVLGSGVEWAFAPNWLLRVEGLTYLADKRINTSALTGDSEPEDFVRFGTVNVVRAGISYKY
jgi:outer membrane immunogenic protein